ncbi:MAG: hypothetical protein WKG00_18405 [Polyangiaceae bacterium]
MDEAALVAKLAKLEALVAGGATEGERAAAASARDRVRARLHEQGAQSPPVEYKFSVGDAWSHKVLVALLRRYGIRPYRYRGQRRTTVMARVPKRFVDETLWPHFERLSAELRTYLDEVTERVVRAAIDGDTAEAAEEAEPAQRSLELE